MTPLTKFRKLIKPHRYVIDESVWDEIERLIVESKEKNKIKAIVDKAYDPELGTYDYDYIAEKVLEYVDKDSDKKKKQLLDKAQELKDKADELLKQAEEM